MRIPRTLRLISVPVFIATLICLAYLSGIWPSVDLEVSGNVQAKADLAIGVFLLLPLSIVATLVVGKLTRYETTVPNHFTIFATVFGVLVGLYALYVAA